MIIHYHHKGPFGWDNHGKTEVPDDQLFRSPNTFSRISLIDQAVAKCRVHCSLVWNNNQLHEWELEVLHPKNTPAQDFALIREALDDFRGWAYKITAAEAALKRLEKMITK